ncbi:MAG TPA: ribosome small subunit-dependent GTPase A, partial [Planctomycetota bacterium]|nr:ribosome small subunit-dependent GTPase A [Planctomycetota bacterium]
RMMRHWLDREEEQRRKQEARKRRATRHERPRPGRHWHEDDDAEVFEKMPKSGVAAKPRAGIADGATADLPRAVVVALHHGRVDLDTGASARVAARLFTSGFQLAVGDEVAFTNTEGPPRIEAVLPRRSWLSRPDPGNNHRDLLLAANVDVAVVTVAVAAPPLRPGLIDRFLLALANGGVAPAICVNKVDLVDDATEVDRVMAPYVELQVPVFACSAARQSGLAPLRAHLAGKTCVFVGHSGVGKSSLLNTLDPDGGRQVGAVRPDGKGNHTTSWSSMRRLLDGTRIIDTPGIRALGLERLDAGQVRAGFAEFAVAGRCRFADCSHRDEPDCAVRAAAAAGRISRARYDSYLRILQSLEP